MLSFQDIVNKPQYTLVIRKGTSYEDYFSSANYSTNPLLSTLWSRIKTNSKSLATSNTEVEKGLLENPNLVYFGPEFQAQIKIGSIPCKIVATSKALSQVHVFFMK
jgi:hypothetical protein